MSKVNIIPRPNSITLLGGTMPAAAALTPKFERLSDGSLGNEGYNIRAEDGKIIASACSKAGFFYAEKTLEQLAAGGEMPCMNITDRPRFSYRGFLLDSARHMQSIDEIKKLIDAAALLKFNKMHWHLSDDQGYRIESEIFPLLNEKGSWREGDDFGGVHKTERYGGFYTKAQIKEIVDYCAERFIEVIPEIDLPGHTIALISSYPALSCRKLQIPVETKQGIFDDILCAGSPTTLEFVFGLLDEVSALFPSPLFHIGGDEAPKKRWQACPKCRAKMKELGLSNAEELQGWFTNEVIAHLKTLGKTATVWNESLISGTLNESAVAQMWMDKKGLCAIWANRGNKVISSDFYHYYCDYPYAMTPLKKTYEYNPVHKNIAAIMYKSVIGVEATIWTEYISDFSRLCYLCFPRFAAVAENGWTQRALLKTESFERRFKAITPLLEGLGIHPAPPADWNPKSGERLKGVVGFFKDKIDIGSLKSSVETKKKP